MLRTERHARLMFDRVKAAVPDAQLRASDYDFSFCVISNKSRSAVWLYRVPRPDIGDSGEKTSKHDLPEIIRVLQPGAQGPWKDKWVPPRKRQVSAP